MAITEQRKKTKKTTIFRYIYILFTIVVIVLIGVLDKNFAGLVNALSGFSLKWLIISCIGILLYWITDAWLLKDITSYLYDGKFTFLSSLKVGLIGLYYGALTPSATGGQPMQVMYMKRDKVNTGIGTGIICVKFVAYELSLCAIYIVFMALKGSNYYTHNSQIFWLTILGFLINLAIVVFIFVIMISRSFIMKLGTKFINFFSRRKFIKWKIIKDKEKSLAGFEKTVNEFSDVIKYIKKHKLRFLGSFILSTVNLLILFIILYFVYRTMGLNQYSVLDIVALNNFMYMAVSLVPTPGSSGASEGAFYILFSGIFPESMMFMGMLLWRFYVYYLILFVGSIIVVGDEVITMRRNKKKMRQAGI